MSKISVINYGMGNIWSIRAALNHLNISNNVVSDTHEFKNSDMYILPGVGSYRVAMQNIRNNFFLKK
jgi:glutamine amidotransferase